MVQDSLEIRLETPQSRTLRLRDVIQLRSQVFDRAYVEYHILRTLNIFRQNPMLVAISGDELVGYLTILVRDT